MQLELENWESRTTIYQIILLKNCCEASCCVHDVFHSPKCGIQTSQPLSQCHITVHHWDPSHPHLSASFRWYLRGIPSGSEDKEFACNAGDLGLIPGLGKSPGEGNGNPLQYSCLENSMDT